MAGHDVTDLVAHDAGQLVLGVGQGEKPPRDVDEPAGKGERVGLGVVRDVELVRRVRRRRLGDEPASDLSHVADERRVLHQPHGALDLARCLLAELTLLLLRDERGTRLTGRAARGEQGHRPEAALPACHPETLVAHVAAWMLRSNDARVKDCSRRGILAAPTYSIGTLPGRTP